ncbi:unnamed protein product [Rotaria sp. Silwood1]|nr:unnamed protein product [Rotaria sp. Silwood1]CAF3624495.1 unnamed protein product [Rotaria sp. Silwood1]CAF4652290.1 unnamed protein product [Rotaria sp. Silwood1]
MFSKTEEDRLSLSDIIMPCVYIRSLLVYNYHIDDLEQPFNEYLRQFCPQALKRIIDDDCYPMGGRIVDCENEQERKVFSRESRLNESIVKYLGNDLLNEDIFPYGIIPTDLSPLIFIHQIYLQDGTLLAIGCHHYLTDGHGLSTLGQRFASWLKEKKSLSFDHDRSKLQNLARLSSIQFDHPEMSLVEPIGYSLFARSSSNTIVKCYTKTYLFIRLNIMNKNGLISVNDVLTAWLTQIISRIRCISRQSTVKIGMAMNGRTFLPGIDANYFGNCTFYLCLSFSMSDLDDLTIDELAQRINIEKRKLMTTEYIESALAFIDKHYRSSMIHLGWQTTGGNDLSFTNWTRFPLYRCDFGQGGAKQFKLCSIQSDGLIFILPTMNNDEIELHITLQTEHAKVLLSKLI